MTYPSLVARLSRRSSVRMTAIAAVLAGSSFALPGATAAAGPQVIKASLAYTCQPPAGWQPVPVQVAVSIPGAATVGQPIRPASPAVTVTIPQADTERLAKLNASTVSVEAQLRSQATESGTSVADPWLLAAVSAPVSSTGSLTLHVSGTVQPVTGHAAGTVVFSAAGLSLLLTSQTAATSTPTAASGGSTSPVSMRLNCALNPGQPATLATVPVAAAPVRGPAAPAASTAITWTAGPGGAFSSSGSLITFTDASTGKQLLSCKSSVASGTFKAGRVLPGTGIGSMTAVTFKTCTGSGGEKFTVTTSAAPSKPWLLNVQSYDETLLAANGTITAVMASISGPGCRLTVAGTTAASPGSVSATFTNGFTPSLTLNPTGGTLHIWNVSGCSGLFKSGDSLTLTATYAISTSQTIVPTFCPPPFPVTNGFPFNTNFTFPPYPPGSRILHSPGNGGPPTQGCTYIEGFSDVQKLGEAALVGPGFANVQLSRRTVYKPPSGHYQGYLQADSSGMLYFKPCPGNAPQCATVNGLPPVHATFLSFGFMPTTATLQITQIGTLNIVSVGTSFALKYSESMSLDSIRIEKVLVNGVPLNVGNNCHTVTPFRLVLIGKPPYTLQTGGVLAGTITIPHFTGCGVGENLDPIFNASVSGPGNFVKITQGNLCSDWPVPPLPSGCPATVPKPIH